MNILEAEWRRCEKWIAGALEYSLGSFTIDDVWKEIEAGRFILMPGPNHAMVFQVQEFPCKKWLHGVFCGGDLEEIKAAQPYLLAQAKKWGCDGITLAGRKGWGRALKDLGWQPVSESFVRLVETDNGREGNTND